VKPEHGTQIIGLLAAAAAVAALVIVSSLSWWQSELAFMVVE
jgi:hypothetical protein